MLLTLRSIQWSQVCYMRLLVFALMRPACVPSLAISDDVYRGLAVETTNKNPSGPTTCDSRLELLCRYSMHARVFLVLDHPASCLCPMSKMSDLEVLQQLQYNDQRCGDLKGEYRLRREREPRQVPHCQPH
ncbi:hypothetical protein C8Q74DRAFT_1301326 [Fomes fomentarius]|nr:hypothetical protein C8Q74DRAFT_1301326 [Fomes fomentarius]